MRKSYWYIWGLITLLLLVVANVGLAQDSLGMRCVSTLDYWGYVNGIQVVGDLAYVVSGSKFHIVSLADPANPIEVGQASWSDYWGGMSIYVVGNLAYVNPGYGVIVYDVSDPVHLVTLANWQPYPEWEVEDFLPIGDLAIMKPWTTFFTLWISRTSKTSTLWAEISLRKEVVRSCRLVW